MTETAFLKGKGRAPLAIRGRANNEGYILLDLSFPCLKDLTTRSIGSRVDGLLVLQAKLLEVDAVTGWHRLSP